MDADSSIFAAIGGAANEAEVDADDAAGIATEDATEALACLLYTSPSPRDRG